MIINCLLLPLSGRRRNFLLDIKKLLLALVFDLNHSRIINSRLQLFTACLCFEELQLVKRVALSFSGGTVQTQAITDEPIQTKELN